MKILQVATYAVFGGLSLHVLTLSRGLQEKGHDVEVVTMCDGPLVPEFKRAGINVSAVPFLGKKARRDPFVATRVIHYIRRLEKKFEPDVIHTHGPRAHFFAAVAGRVTRRPVVVASAHGSYTQFTAGDIEELDRWQRRFKQFQYGSIDRLTAKRADCMIAVCEATRRDLVDGLGINPEKVRVIHNGIGNEGVSPESTAAIRDELGYTKDDRVVVYVGRIAHHKGSLDLVDAFEQVVARAPNARLLIVGEGPLRGLLAQKIQGKGLSNNVSLTGTRHDAIDVIAASDMLVLPSLSEGLPLALLEAAMLSRAMVATDVGGMPEVVIDNETGLLVPPRDPAALSAAIIELIADDGKRLAMGNKARLLWEREFTATRMIGRMEGLYSGLLARS